MSSVQGLLMMFLAQTSAKVQKKSFKNFKKNTFFAEIENRVKIGFFHFQNKPLKNRATKNL